MAEPMGTPVGVTSGGYNMATSSAGQAPSPLAGVLLDMSNIFEPYTVRQNGKLVKRRVVMTAETLVQMARSDQTQVYYRKGPNNTVELVTWTPRKPNKARAERVGGPQFQVGRVERLQALATLQHYMKGSNIAGAGYNPVYGAWNAEDQTMLENVVSYLQQTAAVRPRQRQLPPATRAEARRGGGPRRNEPANMVVDVLDFGKWLKETTQRQRLDALDKRRIAMQQYSGGGQVVQLTGRGATDSAVDAMFKDLVGRNATTDEKARFFAAFRKDEAAARMAAARANQRDAEAGAMASLDPATRGLLEDEAKFEMYKVDPVIRVGGQLMHASDAPRSEWANIARRHGVNYDAIADYYRRNPKTTPGSVMGGGGQGITTVETTDVGSAAMEAAKASPEYMPTQVGRAGQYFMRMLGGEYGMPGVQSG